jgi:hypothetical protein
MLVDLSDARQRRALEAEALARPLAELLSVPPPPPPLLSVSEAARAVRLPRTTIESAMDNGLLRTFLPPADPHRQRIGAELPMVDLRELRERREELRARARRVRKHGRRAG